MKLVTDSSGKVVTAKDRSNTTLAYQIYIPGTTNKSMDQLNDRNEVLNREN